LFYSDYLSLNYEIYGVQEYPKTPDNSPCGLNSFFVFRKANPIIDLLQNFVVFFNALGEHENVIKFYDFSIDLESFSTGT
jgi:hypothetical protein